MENKRNQGFGLKLVPPDPRNFKLGNVFDLPKLEELPESFTLLGVPALENQGNTDYCTAMATTYLSEFQECRDLEPSWSFAISKMISGDPESWGQDLLTALKAHVKYGAIEKKDSPFSLQKEDSEYLRYIRNWPDELFYKAQEHKKQSFFQVSGQYDHFDNVRAAIWKFKELRRAVGFGVVWSWNTSDVFMKDFQETGTGHALSIIGWDKKDGQDYLVILNSYGPEAGENGRHYFSRDVINHFVELYGAYMFIDLPPAEAKFLNNWQLSPNWRILAKFLTSLKNYFSFFLHN